MAEKRIKRPRDPAELAKLIMDIATGEVQDSVEDGKNAVRVEAGRLGGRIGGIERAAHLTPNERTEIAKTAAKARWSKARD